MDELGEELQYSHFTQNIITPYETEFGEIQGMYRDNRGVLYHPHLGKEIPLGTMTVEKYSRPAWTFNKIIYCEKEGFFPILTEAQWPEIHDCALVTSKGFASRAAKDLLDLLGETEEELTFFCIHDADASGTLIYETLQRETGARPGRKVRVIDLGLNPWEAEEMGLQSEKIKKEKRPVARYVTEYDRANGTNWEGWFQENRYELNAMTTPQFIRWLDSKMEQHDSRKIIPPDEIMIDELHVITTSKLRDAITDKILREANIDNLVETEYKELLPELEQIEDTIDSHVKGALDKTPVLLWKQPIDDIVDKLIRSKDHL